MGWCGGTEIMDAAVQALDEVLKGAYDALGVDSERVTLDDIQDHLDDLARPFVRRIAKMLHQGDWDCVNEAEAFDRFPQEMYDHDDQEHAAWLRDRIRDSDEVHEFEKWTAALRAHTDKMKAGNG
jgi:hypothetical protein